MTDSKIKYPEGEAEINILDLDLDKLTLGDFYKEGDKGYRQLPEYADFPGKRIMLGFEGLKAPWGFTFRQDNDTKEYDRICYATFGWEGVGYNDTEGVFTFPDGCPEQVKQIYEKVGALDRRLEYLTMAKPLNPKLKPKELSPSYLRIIRTTEKSDTNYLMHFRFWHPQPKPGDPPVAPASGDDILTDFRICPGNRRASFKQAQAISVGCVAKYKINLSSIFSSKIGRRNVIGNVNICWITEPGGNPGSFIRSKQADVHALGFTFPGEDASIYMRPPTVSYQEVPGESMKRFSENEEEEASAKRARRREEEEEVPYFYAQ